MLLPLLWLFLMKISAAVASFDADYASALLLSDLDNTSAPVIDF